MIYKTGTSSIDALNFFYKNLFYKNVEAEINQNFNKVLRIFLRLRVDLERFYKQLFDEVFVISRIIKVELGVI